MLGIHLLIAHAPSSHREQTEHPGALSKAQGVDFRDWGDLGHVHGGSRCQKFLKNHLQSKERLWQGHSRLRALLGQRHSGYKPRPYSYPPCIPNATTQSSVTLHIQRKNVHFRAWWFWSWFHHSVPFNPVYSPINWAVQTPTSRFPTSEEMAVAVCHHRCCHLTTGS